jgi:hypothetical protein
MEQITVENMALIHSLEDEIALLKRKLELLDEKYRYAIRKLKMVALELEND